MKFGDDWLYLENVIIAGLNWLPYRGLVPESFPFCPPLWTALVATASQQQKAPYTKKASLLS